MRLKYNKNRFFLLFVTIGTFSISACKKENTGITFDPNSPIVVSDFLPTQGGGGTEILINGENFSLDTAAISIKIGGVPLKVLASNGTQIMAIVPKKGGTGPIEISINGKSGISKDKYTYLFTRTVTTLAGNGTPGFANGKGTDAMFNFSGESWYRNSGIAVDDGLNVYVTDPGNHCIRKIDPSGNVTTFAGSPTNSGTSDGKGGEARFQIPYGLTIDENSNLYVCDPGGWDIRKITPDGTTKIIDWGWKAPWSIAYDKTTKKVYYTCVDSPAPIYQIGPDGGGTTIVTEGMNYPAGMAFAPNGKLYVSVHGDNQIREYDPKTWKFSIIAGTGKYGYKNGTGKEAEFALPWGIAVDYQNNIYVAGNGTNGGDSSSPDQSVRFIDGSTFNVSTFAGSGSSGFTNGVGGVATFNVPEGVTVDKNGTVYVLDKKNNCIRKVISE